MTGARAPAWVAALAAIAVPGIAGMLPARGAWDGVFFAMAASPLLAGIGFRLHARRA